MTRRMKRVDRYFKASFPSVPYATHIYCVWEWCALLLVVIVAVSYISIMGDTISQDEVITHVTASFAFWAFVVMTVRLFMLASYSKWLIDVRLRKHRRWPKLKKKRLL